MAQVVKLTSTSKLIQGVHNSHQSRLHDILRRVSAAISRTHRLGQSAKQKLPQLFNCHVTSFWFALGAESPKDHLLQTSELVVGSVETHNEVSIVGQSGCHDEILACSFGESQSESGVRIGF